jgi:hypothetical protein
MFKKIIRIAILSALAIVGILGIIFTAQSSALMGGGSVFFFFTVQSNIFIIAMALIFLINEIVLLITKKSFINQTLLFIKYVATVAITVTFLVFFTMLAPLMGVDYLLSFNNFSLHAIVPILAIVDFIFFDTDINLTYSNSLLATIAPISYVLFVYIGACFKLQYGENLYYPYFFLDFETNGFLFEKGFGIIPWIIILLAGICGLGCLYCFIIKARQKSIFKKES